MVFVTCVSMHPGTQTFHGGCYDENRWSSVTDFEVPIQRSQFPASLRLRDSKPVIAPRRILHHRDTLALLQNPIPCVLSKHSWKFV